MKSNEKKFNIRIKGDKETEFYTKVGFLVARGYNKIVIGERGPYIEFTKTQIIRENIFIPDNQKWRINSPKAYYIEYRSKRDYVKIYFQKKLVQYADYQVGFYYISPEDLSTSWNKNKGKIIREKRQINLENFIGVD